MKRSSAAAGATSNSARVHTPSSCRITCPRKGSTDPATSPPISSGSAGGYTSRFELPHRHRPGGDIPPEKPSRNNLTPCLPASRRQAGGRPLLRTALRWTRGRIRRNLLRSALGNNSLRLDSPRQRGPAIRGPLLCRCSAVPPAKPKNPSPHWAGRSVVSRSAESAARKRRSE